MNWGDVDASKRMAVCPFQKHKGRLWTEILEGDRKYIEWLVSHQGPRINARLYDHLMDLLEG